MQNIVKETKLISYWEIVAEHNGGVICRCANCKEYQCQKPSYCAKCGAEMKGEKQLHQ